MFGDPAMTDTLTSTAPNVDVTGPRPRFEEADLGSGEMLYTIVLDDLIADWGEGSSKHEAVLDLAMSLRRAHDDLHDLPDEKLGTGLQYERDFLCALLHPDVPR